MDQFPDRNAVTIWQPPVVVPDVVQPWALDPGDPPSLKPDQIARLSREFYDNMTALQRLWCLCGDVVEGFRGYMGTESLVRSGMEMAYFNRPRDVSFNITQPQVRNASARLDTDIPSWGVRGASNSLDDLAKSQACTQLLGYYYEEQELKYAIGEAIDWAIVFGTSAMLAYMAGDDVKPDVFGPDRIRAEPGIANPDKSRFLAVSRITTRGDLKRRFPGHDDIIDEADSPMQQNTWWGDGQRLPEDRVEVLEAYCRSGHWFLLVGKGGTVLAHGKTPQKCMPIQIFRYTPLTYRFFGMGMVEQALPAQYAYSTSWNQIMANARLMSQPKILIHQNSGIAADAFTARAGEKVLYRGETPKPWQGLPLPQFAAQLPANANSALADATGIHSAAQGKRTAGLTTGVAINATVANDEVQFGMTKRDIIRQVSRHGKVFLLYAQTYYSPEKVRKQFGRYGTAIGQMLDASDLADNPQVFVEADTLFKDDVQARQERVMEFARMGAIPPDKAIQMLQQNVDPLKPQKPIADFIEAKKALQAVVERGFSFPDPKGGVDMLGQPLQRKTVKFYRTDNFQVFADVVRQFIRSDEFYALQDAQQDAVDAFYEDILAQMAPPVDPASQGPQKKAPQLPGLPQGATPGNTPGNSGGGDLHGTPERAVALDEGMAEVRDEQT